MQVSFVTVAAWWLIFTIPVMRGVRERRAGPQLSLATRFPSGFRELGNTISHLRQYRILVLFLLAYWFYIDGVNTIIKMAVNYGTALGLDTGKLLLALLVTQLVGFPAALMFGWLGDRIGPKRGILIGLVVYAASPCMPISSIRSANSSCSPCVGLVQGGVQSLSRSLFGRLVPEGKNAEFFGFYNMMGKFATVLGPLLIAIVAGVTHNERASIVSLVLLFVVGGVLLWRVPITPRVS